MSLLDIDLDELASSGVDVTLRDPISGQVGLGDDGNPVIITVLGKDSSLWRQKAKEIKAKKGLKDNAGVDDLADMLPDMLAECTMGWSDNAKVNGEALPFTKENAAKLYKERNWVFEQVLSAALSRAQLKKKSLVN